MKEAHDFKLWVWLPSNDRAEPFASFYKDSGSDADSVPGRGVDIVASRWTGPGRRQRVTPWNGTKPVNKRLQLQPHLAVFRTAADYFNFITFILSLDRICIISIVFSVWRHYNRRYSSPVVSSCPSFIRIISYSPLSLCVTVSYQALIVTCRWNYMADDEFQINCFACLRTCQEAE
jgi:hypothetical protein